MSKTILETLEEYQQFRGKQEAANIRSVIKTQLLPQLLPVLGLQSLQHKPVPYVLDQIFINGFIAIADPIVQKHLPLVENPKTRKVLKSQWKRFCQWLQEQKWYSHEPPQLRNCEEEPVPKFTHLPTGVAPKPRKVMNQWRGGLKKAELTPKLKQQLQDFHKFCQTISRDRQQANRDTSQKHYQDKILVFLGWLKNVKNVPVAELGLFHMTDLSLLKQYEQWNEQRGMASKTILTYLRTCISVCQFCFSQSYGGEELKKKMKPFREFVNAIPDRKDRPRTSDEAYAERVLTRQQCETILQYLGWRCKDLQKQQGATDAVIDVWMDYLIIALLVTTGVRQREIRELSLERLSLNADGTYSVKLKPADHKTGTKTGKGRGYPLFVGPLQKQLSSDLSYYLDHVRPGQQLNHDCLFFIRHARTTEGIPRLRGDRILCSEYLSRRVPALIYKVTAHLFGPENAKATTCHDFRRITATWVCTYGSPTHFPLYAEMLGHSENMLRNQYAKIHPGAMAAQVPIAYQEIVENENRVTKRLEADESRVPGSIPQTHLASDGEQVELMRSMFKILWMALSKPKRNEVLQILTPAQRQLLNL